MIILSTFESNMGPGRQRAAHMSGAVGPEHVAHLDAGGFVVHDKATGKVLERMSRREFRKHVEPSCDPHKDPKHPKITYDPLSQPRRRQGTHSC